MSEENKQISVSLQSVAWAFSTVRMAHLLLNAVLDDKPKAAIIRELCVDLSQFQAETVSCVDLDDVSAFEKVVEAFIETEFYTVSFDDESGNLILKEKTEMELTGVRQK
jgi:hypothetical protein